MIRTDDGLHRTREALAHLEEALHDLTSKKDDYHPATFAALARPIIDDIRTYRATIDTYIGLPTGYVEEYWKDVEDLLTTRHGIDSATTRRYIARLRRRLSRRGETIYTDERADVAEYVAGQVASDTGTPLVPTAEAIAKLPWAARRAFSARCARRVQPAYGYYWTDAAPEHVGAVAAAVSLGEQLAAGDIRRTQLGIPPAPFHRELLNVRDAAWAAADAAQRAGRGLDDPAYLAARIATFAVESDGDGSSAAKDASYVADLTAELLTRTARVSTTLTQQLLCIRRDYDRLARWAKENNWADDTSVLPKVFGRMWPTAGVSPVWARGPSTGPLGNATPSEGRPPPPSLSLEPSS